MSRLPDYHTTVIDDWIDYNDHLSEAFYVLIFGSRPASPSASPTSSTPDHAPTGWAVRSVD